MNYQEITVIFSLFNFGLLGGFSHCAGMCGPFVLSQVDNRLSNIKISDVTTLKKIQGLVLLPYHLGRITTYCFIAIISAISYKNLVNIFIFKRFAATFLVVAALIIFNSTIAKIKLPFKMPAFFKGKKQFSHFFGKISIFLQKKIKFLFLDPTSWKGYLLGLLLGFIPCGLVYGAIVASLALSSFWKSAFAVFAFGIGTIPSLFITAYGGYWFFDKINNRLKIFTKLILLINIANLLILAFALIFNYI